MRKIKIIYNPPNGFYYFSQFITLEEEEFLLKELSNLNWQKVQMYGVIAKRRVVHFGYDYTYDNRTIKPTIGLPVFLEPFLKRAASSMQIAPSDIAEILITEYPPGAKIGWHRDAAIFGHQVFGISLASSAILKLRMKNKNYYEVFSKELVRCSGYILAGVARTLWQHSIMPVKQIRYSITFRTLRK